MRHLVLLAAFCAATAQAQVLDVQRLGPAESPISASVEVPPGSVLVYVSGTAPDPIDAAAPVGSVRRYGDTEAQTRSILTKIQAQLRLHALDLGDVVMMRVFLVAPPGQARMDFAGMMRAYREFFGNAALPNRPSRSTMQVAGLVDPGWLVEIEVTAAVASLGGLHASTGRRP
jgi:enamine deaminase RidA (YjgF/YER057c/UK114 family)